MSYIPIPTNPNSSIFNENNWNSNEPETTDNNDIDLSDYVSKNKAETLTYPLTLSQINFSDGSQEIAFKELYKDNIISNTDKLQEITKLTDYTFIDNLKVDDIQFMDAKQNQAFTDNHKSQIYANEGNIKTNKEKLLPFTTLTDRVILSKRLWFDDVGYIDTYGGVLRIDSNQDTPIALNPGKNQWLSLYANTVHIGRDDFGRIYMNDEVQNHCYTDADHDNVNLIPTLSSQVGNINNLLNSKVKATVQEGYNLFNLFVQFPSGSIQTVDYQYHFTTTPDLSNFVQYYMWNGGNRTLLFTYNIYFESNADTTMKTRIVIKNNGSDRYMSNWNGVPLVTQTNSNIMYSSTHMVDVIDGDKFYLHTDLIRNNSPVSSETMSCVIHIIEI
jgi:hypothetical protein